MLDRRSRISGKRKNYWFDAIKTGLMCGLVTLMAAIIVLKIAYYTPFLNSWQHNIAFTSYAGKALVLLSLLLILNEIIVTRHPFYEIWLLAALGGIIGVLAW